MKATYDPTLYKIAIVSLALLVLSTCFNMWLVLRPKSSNCDDFGSYADIVHSFLRGNSKLDGNRNGIPCEQHIHE